MSLVEFWKRGESGPKFSYRLRYFTFGKVVKKFRKNSGRFSKNGKNYGKMGPKVASAGPNLQGNAFGWFLKMVENEPKFS